MGQLSELDEIAEGLLEDEIEGCLLGRTPIPSWLQDSLERISEGKLNTLDESVDSGVSEQKFKDSDSNIA